MKPGIQGVPSAAGGTLQGKHAFVTGGGRGIGSAIAHALLLQGARVTLAGRTAAVLEQTARELASALTAGPSSETGGCAIDFVTVDVTSRESVNAALAEAARRHGPIAILVNNAGQAASAPFAKTGDDIWRQMMAVNLDGTYHCIQAALPGMLAAGWGRIVNIASTAGMTGYAYVSAYCAAKHGVIGLTRSLALELATKGITVNAVCPGYTETDIVKDAVANIVAKTGRSEEQARAELAAGNPQKQLVQPDQVANAVAWLCQPGASAMTGQSLAVAGGEIM
ncbi:SDR family NAD(P)-dependent oxidoreductase [Pseudoduganella aquatica]|uniref:SDR family NAD(P)-dependent oxidoreductase n=1 Tax=Pseudoduganella aquatica TaxID=2660641 RepID=A0A7X4HFG9_9BURK|nr:SDR family NAD(P)-dependent oxidoreductase [Pseudoduganella aquatica]MYN09994.1 SDR family NAD(P)-dependent oxidoreductase [Pseudoduganella aquatica]